MKQKAILFLSTSIPFGLIVALVYWRYSPDVLTIIYAGVIFGLGTTISLSILQWIIVRSKGIQGDVKVVCSTQFLVEGTREEVFDLCDHSISTIDKCKLGYYDPKEGIAKAKAGKSWLTWGDEITFQLKEIKPNEFCVTIVSRPVVRTTVIDYGKNLENINRISDYFMNNTYLNVRQEESFKDLYQQIEERNEES